MPSAITTPNDAARANGHALILSATRENKDDTEYRLVIDATVIMGSASQCGLSLAGDDVSALHCSLRWDAEGIWLEDWGSSDGTFVNGEEVTTEVLVELKSKIRVGSYTIGLRFDEPQSPHVTPVTSNTVGSGNGAVAEFDESQLATPVSCSALAEVVAPKLPNSARALTASVANHRGPVEVQCDAMDQETFEMLRAEVEQLQFEVAERDAQLAEALAAEHEPEVPMNGACINQLMERLEAQLDELDRSDERMRTLEQLLRMTEEANRDEREERRQMESWLGDIESVFGEHQATWDSEMTELRNRMAAVAAERDQLLQQLTQPRADDHAEQDAEETAKLRHQVKHLQKRVDEATAAGTRQQEELRRREAQLAEATKLENTLREDHLKLAAERASLSRLRAEITAEQADHENRLQGVRSDTDIDSRVRGFRQHLREINEEENQEEIATSLPGRLARLWKRMDAHR